MPGVNRAAWDVTSLGKLTIKLKDLYIAEREKGKPSMAMAVLSAIYRTEDKVAWLRQLGADVNAIARIYAEAGDDERVEEYRINYGASVDAIAQGYAVAGNDVRVYVYRITYGASIDAIAQSYAVAGNDERVEEYRAKYGASVDAIAQGYALAGNEKKVEEYRTTYGANVDIIAQGYSLAGWDRLARRYQITNGASVDAIAQAYALAGNDELVEVYRSMGASVHAIAQGYAAAGNHERVEAYLTQYKASFNAIAQGYALAGILDEQEKYHIIFILDNYLKKRTAIINLSGETKGYFHNSLFSFFQKSFKQKNNAVTALKCALEGNDVDLSEHLSTLRNGKLGQELRKFIKSGIANALVNKEVDTVSDFVQALQDNISNKPQKNSFS